MAFSSSLGLAMKKSPIGMDLTATGPLTQDAPLANDGPLQKSISVANPLTWIRRIGAACETAQNSPCWQPSGLDTVMVRFSNDRQKLTRAMQVVLLGPRHWLRTFIDPLMTTSFGERPRPATAV